MKSIIRWGILGTANIAKIAVAPAIKEARNAELVAIAGRNGDKIARFTKVYPCEKTYFSYEELLADKEIDAVYIPLPNSLHREWAIKAMMQGKHVLCEKPLGCTAEEVRQMIQTSKDYGVLLEEAFAYRHNPLIIQLKELIDAGKIGNVKHIQSSFSFLLTNREDIRLNKVMGGGAIYDIGCYPIHLIRYLAGQEPNKVISSLSFDKEKNVDVSSSAILEFPNGIKGSLYCSFESPFHITCEVSGEKGILTCRRPFNQEGDLEIIFKSSDSENEEVIGIHSPNNYTLEVEDFSECILMGTKPLVTLEDSLNNAIVIDSILD